MESATSTQNDQASNFEFPKTKRFTDFRAPDPVEIDTADSNKPLIQFRIVCAFFIIFFFYFLIKINEGHIIPLIIIGIAIFICMCFFYKDFNKNSNLWANLILGLGTLGTFWGIYSAFEHFEINKTNIDILNESITIVLDSLKFVFATSILGLGTSIALRAIKGWHRKQANQYQEFRQQQYLFDAIHSFTNNIYYLREDWRNKTEYFIDTAYTKLIEKINENVDKSLGEKFRLFNEGMANLVDFQKQHIGLIEKSGNTFAQIQEQSQAMNEIISKQKDILDEIKPIINTFLKSIETETDFLQNAKHLITEANEKQKELSETISENYTYLKDILKHQDDNLRQKIEEQNKELKELIELAYTVISIKVEKDKNNV